MSPPVSQRILIVDDDPLDREVYKRYLLETPGRIFSFAEESTGAAALERLKNFAADCVLLDFNLPDMNGLELLSKMREGNPARTAPIVMMTAIRDERVAVEAMKSGVMDYLPKGHMAAETLSYAVDNAIEKFRMQRALGQQQLALESSERRYRELIEAIPHVVWTATSTGTLDYVNRQWFEYLGMDLESFTLTGWPALLHPEDRDGFTEKWEEGLRAGLPFQIEHRLKQRSKGDFRWYLSHAVPIRNDAGEVIKWFGTSTDIEDQKRAETAVLSKQKLESVGLLAGGIAHDFNNLLVGILGGASYVAEELPASHPLQATLSDVVLAGERAAHLTRQMLAYAGKGQFFVESLDLNELIRTTCDLIKSSIPKRVKIHLELSQDLPRVEGDSGQMQQIIMNLVLNAGESIDESRGGVVTVRTDLPDLDAAAIKELDLISGTLQPGKHVLFEVRDTGSGMSEETKAKIFDPFFTTKFTGRGLGLSAVHGILRSQKGAIAIHSTLGAGSEFRIFLPASVKAVFRKEAPGESAGQGTGTILFVDDEDLVRRTAKASLEHNGFRVLLAGTGEQAMALLLGKTDPVSLVVLDMSMPGMSGRQVLQQIRLRAIEVPVLICSGYSESEVYQEFSGLDIAGFVQKPFTARQLGARVSHILGSGQPSHAS